MQTVGVMTACGAGAGPGMATVALGSYGPDTQPVGPGRSRSELVRDALRRQLALDQLADLRQRIMPLAEARGYLTDEDICRDVS